MKEKVPYDFRAHSQGVAVTVLRSLSKCHKESGYFFLSFHKRPQKLSENQPYNASWFCRNSLKIYKYELNKIKNTERYRNKINEIKYHLLQCRIWDLFHKNCMYNWKYSGGSNKKPYTPYKNHEIMVVIKSFRIGKILVPLYKLLLKGLIDNNISRLSYCDIYCIVSSQSCHSFNRT